MKDPISLADLERWIDRSMALSPGAVRAASDSGAPSSLLPAWILLDQEAYIDDEDRENATTAVARTSSGDSVKVSFFAAPPPLLSHFSVHCPGLTEEFDFLGRPCILFSVDNLALIRVTFACGPETGYFIYRAGRGRRPSLVHLRDIGSYLSNVPFVASIGFLPHGCEGDDFVLAALGFTLVAGQYELHVFRSERGTWTSSVVLLGSHLLTNIEKVIALGGGKLGFVDLWKGILVCSLFLENPTTHFIPAPKLLPNNNSVQQLGSARPFRDVIYTNGLIRCVELEICSQCINHEVPKVSNMHVVHDDVSSTDVLLDSYLMPDGSGKAEEEKNKEDIYVYLGWRIIVWSRTLSTTFWRKEHLIHVNDIHGKNPIDTYSMDDLGDTTAHTLRLKDLFTSTPTLSLDDCNSLYLTSKVKQGGDELLVIMIDMEKKTVEEFSPILTQRPNLARPTYIPCALSKYLKDTGGTMIGGQTATWLASSTVEASNESINSCITVSDHCPPAERYCGYSDGSPVTPSGAFPCYGDNHRRPAVVPPLLQQSLSASDETDIGWQNVPWSTSSTLQRTKESVGSCITPSDNCQHSHYYHSICPVTPSSIIPGYGDYRQQQWSAVPYPLLQPSPPSADESRIGVQTSLLSASSRLQPTEESVDSCIMLSDHYSHAYDCSGYHDSSTITSSGTFPCYGNYHQQQQKQPQEIAHPLWHQSPPADGFQNCCEDTLRSRSTVEPTRGRARQSPLQPTQGRARQSPLQPTQGRVKQFPSQPIQDRQSSLSTLQPNHRRGTERRKDAGFKPGRWSSTPSCQSSTCTVASCSHEQQQGWHEHQQWQQGARRGPSRALWQEQ